MRLPCLHLNCTSRDPYPDVILAFPIVSDFIPNSATLGTYFGIWRAHDAGEAQTHGEMAKFRSKSAIFFSSGRRR